MLPMRTTPPFRAAHVGSLLRPATVLAARADFAAGRIGADQHPGLALLQAQWGEPFPEPLGHVEAELDQQENDAAA